MNKKSLRRRIWEILEKGNSNDKVSFYTDIFLITLIVFNIIAVLLETVDSIYSKYAIEFLIFERFSTVVFLIEYILRIWVCVEEKVKNNKLLTRLRYASTWPAIIDLLAVLSGLLPMIFEVDLRILRALRMLRLLKFSRYFKVMNLLLGVLKEEKQSFLAAMFLLTIAMLIASTGIYLFEKDAQPDKFSSIPETMWWSLITLTTVGYGDVSPISPLGKIIGAFTAVMGVFSVALLTGIVSNAFAHQVAQRKAILEAQIANALEDGEIDSEEQAEIDTLRKRYDISEDHVKAIIEVLKDKSSSKK